LSDEFCELLLHLCNSLLLQNAKRASEAAAPLAAWVTANIKYAAIIEKIEPLESEQAELQK
jgi:dynein heavy chain 2